MMNAVKRSLILSAVVLSAGALVPTPALAQSARPISAPVPLSAAAVEGYWTAERMRDATPMPMPELQGAPPETALQATGPEGPGVIANSGGPGDIPQEQTLEPGAEPPEPTFGTYPFSYTRYRLFPDTAAQYKTFPYKMVGKLFFTKPGQGNFVCSAASVNSTNRSVVWTAGHCVATPGVGFHTNFLFAPARRLGTNPFGTWTVKQVWTIDRWVNFGEFEYDLGALVMNLQGSARIGNKVGFLGFLANASRQQHWHLHGYPADPRNLGSTPPGAQFDGVHHEICSAAWGTDDDPGAGAGPLTIGVGCDQTGGASGGPWIVDLSGVNSGQTNLINGVNSYKYSNLPLLLFSPYLDQAAIDLRNAAQATPVP